MDWPGVLDALRLALPLAFLSFFAWEDIRTRSIHDIPVYMYASASALIALVYAWMLGGTGYSAYMPVYTVLLAVVVAVSALLWLVGAWAEGDAWLFASTGVLTVYPYARLLPGSPLPPLIYYLFSLGVSGAVLVTAKTLSSARHIGRMKGVAGIDKLVLLLGGTPMRARDYLETRHTYLLAYPDGDGYRVRRYIDAERDSPEEDRRLVERMLAEGAISGDDTVWVSKGIPFTAVLLVAYTVYLTALLVLRL